MTVFSTAGCCCAYTNPLQRNSSQGKILHNSLQSFQIFPYIPRKHVSHFSKSHKTYHQSTTSCQNALKYPSTTQSHSWISSHRLVSRLCTALLQLGREHVGWMEKRCENLRRWCRQTSGVRSRRWWWSCIQLSWVGRAWSLRGCGVSRGRCRRGWKVHWIRSKKVLISILLSGALDFWREEGRGNWLAAHS